MVASGVSANTCGDQAFSCAELVFDGTQRREVVKGERGRARAGWRVGGGVGRGGGGPCTLLFEAEVRKMEDLEVLRDGLED